MNILRRFIVPCRVVYSAHYFIPRIYKNRALPTLIPIVISGSTRAMSQRSITSFFKVSPPKGTTNSSVNTAKVKEEKTDEQTENIKTPNTNGKEKRCSKRQRLESGGSESDIKTTEASPTASGKKKQVKRQRIESSGSEAESPKSETNTKQRKDSASCEPEVLEMKENIKVEKTSPKTYASPKSRKAKSALLSKTLSEKKVNVKKETTSQSDGEGSEETDVKSKKESDGEGSGKEDVKDGKIKEEVKKEVTEKVAEVDYNPTKPKYHPIKDACWAQGEEVPYLAIAKTFEAIEAISARLKMIEILANLFRSVIALTPEDLLPCIYMCLNQLAPAYHSLELGIAETYLLKAVGQCTGCSLGQVRAAARRSGDLGQAAQLARSTQRTLCAPPPLKARRVFAALKDIAHMTGQASVNKKISKIQSLYVACRHSEAKYLIRSLEGKLRIGLAEQSVLQALALATALTPPDPRGTKVLDASKGLPPDKFKAMVESNALTIKTTYCECPNYELVVPVLLREGVAALPQHCRLTPGIPLKPMLAHPTKGVHEVFNRFEGCRFTCEWKYDGERAQIHVPGESRPDLARAALFSRNQENNTSKYPDILRRLPSLLKGSVGSCVLDCEAVAYDTHSKQILPFQILSTRKRKDASEADIKVQVCVFVFDLLYLNGEPLVRTPLERRRGLLREHFNEVPGEWQFATSKDCTSMEEVQQFLEEAVRGSCEGLMVKTLEGDSAYYDIARRSHNWLKLKKDYLDGVGDTLDVVVLGGYLGRGRRRGVYGGFLLACRDPAADLYQSLCKIGTGFTDDDLQTLSAQLNEHLIDAPRNYYMFDSSHTPDAWFSAACVWEVRCADLSLSPAHRAAAGLVAPDKGISLRFPRFVRVREDKSPEEATSAQQVASMYLAQDQVKNQTNKPLPMDDFY